MPSNKLFTAGMVVFGIGVAIWLASKLLVLVPAAIIIGLAMVGAGTVWHYLDRKPKAGTYVVEEGADDEMRRAA